MNAVEDEIVSMKFDNRQFLPAVNESLSALSKLQEALQFKDTGKGLGDLNAGVGKFDPNPIISGVGEINKAFLAMTTIAVTALATIVSKAVDAGLQLGKSLTISPITSGFQEYQTQIGAIQTILANTGLKGQKGLDQVKAALNNLNHYADKTIYNFTEMTRNIGTFTAAGIDLKTSTEAIKGIANLAAVSGSNAQQASTAMYQLSQALAAGRVGLQDWNSVVNAGMGGRVFQEALLRTAQNMGTVNKNAVQMVGPMKQLKIAGESFRDSISAKPGSTPWLTSDVLTQTLNQLSGDLTDAQLKAQGYTKEQRKAILELARTGVNAATKVKTLSQLVDTLREAVGSGWTQTFQLIFGDFNQAKTLFTGLSNYFGGFISAQSKARNDLLKSWSALGGRQELLDGLKQAFKDLVRLVVPIKNAFRDIFPATTGKNLLSITKAFHNFFTGLRLNVKTMREIRDVFDGIFTIFHIGFDIASTLFGILFKIFGLSAGPAAGGLLKFFAGIGRAITKFGDAYDSAGGLAGLLKFFSKGSRVISVFVGALKPLVPILKNIAASIGDLVAQGYSIASGIIGGLLEGLDSKELQDKAVELANNIIKWIKDTLGIHSPASTMVPIGVNIVLGIVEGIKNTGRFLTDVLQSLFSGLAKGLGKAVEGLGEAFKLSIKNMDLESFLDIINTLLTGGFLVAATKIANAFKSIGGGAAGVLNQITNNLKTMQNKVRAEIIQKIALSVLALAGASYILSTIDGKKLKSSLAAVGALMIGLVASMKVLTAGGTKGGLNVKETIKKAATINAMATAMVAFSTAVLIMAGAVAILGNMNPETIQQGLIGVGVIVAGLTAATAILSKTGGGATIFAAAAALLVLSVALSLFAATMKLYSELPVDMIIDGGGKAAAVIIGLGLAMRSFGKYAFTGSAGLLIASVALLIMAKSLEKFAALDPKKMGDALTAMVVLIGTVALASAAMRGGASVGLILAAASLIIFAEALKIVSKISGKNLIKAIFFLTVAIGGIVAAALLLAPAIPVIDAFGAAILLVGAGVALAGLGFLSFAGALGIIAIVGPAAFQALYDGAKQFIDIAPEFMKNLLLFAGTLVVFAAGAVIGGAGAVVLAAGLIVLSVAIVAFSAALVIAAAALLIFVGTIKLLSGQISPSLDGARKAIQRFTDIKAILSGIRDKVTGWISGLIDDFKGMVTPIVNALVNLKDKMKEKITGWADDLLNDAKDLGWAIINGILDGLEAGWHWVTDKAASLGKAALDAAKHTLHIFSPSRAFKDEVGKMSALGLAQGLDENSHYAQKSAADVANKSLDAMKYVFRNSKKMGDDLIDVRPKITPILDLTQLERDASQISGRLSGRHIIDANVSRSRAADISANHSARIGHSDEVRAGDTYNFNQEISSPSPVNHVKVYRGTKSQIALFREVTGK